jgi:hypothetical protein
MMEPLTLTNSEQIMEVLVHVHLKGQGFTTECLLDNVLDAGINAPDYFAASGADPDAYYQEEPGAWSDYHVRQSKKVFIVYGGAGKIRRSQITDTP